MDTFALLGHGLLVALEPMNLLYALIGVTLGTAVGVLPGIGPALTVALLLPVTYKLDPAGSLIMFAGIYYGGMYGGSTTSILLNTPGESASIVTALEGNKMARAGRGGPALATAAIGSFVAGLIATIGLAFIAPWVVKFALAFGPAEYFALMVLAFMTVSAAFGDSTLRGLTALALGLAIGLVGIDLQTGQARLTFGMPDLLDGIEVTTVAVALFAVGEALSVAAAGRRGADRIEPVRGSVWMSKLDWARSWKPWLRGTLIGFPIGAMPAGGAEIGTFLSYAAEKRLSKHPEEFGHGAIEGVAGPEAANNAGAQTAFIPLLTLGIPPNAVMALMVGAMTIHGVVPGPQVMTRNPDLFWGMIASMWLGNLMLLVINLPLIGLWVRFLKVPYRLMFPAILAFCCIGIYSVNNQPFDVALAAFFGLVGYALIKLRFEPAPLLLGFVLGELMEEYLRRAMLLSRGDPMVFVERPLSATLLVLAALILLVALLPSLRRKRDEAFQE